MEWGQSSHIRVVRRGCSVFDGWMLQLFSRPNCNGLSGVNAQWILTAHSVVDRILADIDEISDSVEELFFENRIRKTGKIRKDGERL